MPVHQRVGDGAEVDHPRPERLERGNPRRETWNLVDAALPPGRLYAGVWRCEPGQWRIAFGPTEQEIFTVLEGRARLHRDDGSYEEAGPGQAIRIPPGFSGSFEVIERMTKVYVIIK